MTLKDLAEEFKRKKEELLKNIESNQDLTANLNKILDLKGVNLDFNNKNNKPEGVYNEGDNNINNNNDLDNNIKEKDKNNDIDNSNNNDKDNNNDNNISTLLTS